MFVPIVTLGLLGVTLTALLRLAETARGAVDRGSARRIRTPARLGILHNPGRRDENQQVRRR